MNRLSILIGWLALTSIAIGVSSAAVGNVGERVSPQPASVLEAAGDVVALGAPEAGASSTTRATVAPSSSIVEPGDAATAPPASTSTTVTATTTSPAPTTTRPGASTTTTEAIDTTTTTVHDGTTTTTVVDASTTTTAPPTTTTTTIPEDGIEDLKIHSKGGWIWIKWSEERLNLVGAAANRCCQPDVVEDTRRRIIVRFTLKRSDDLVSRIVVRLIDGDAKVEVSEFSPDR